jgi:cytochrome c-type biogenesis protein CcmE
MSSTAAAPAVDRKTAWKIVGTVVVVVGAVGALLWSSMKEEVQFWKYADEVAAQPNAFAGKHLNVGGFVKSISHDSTTLDYDFVIETRPPRQVASVKAHYHGVVPDTFKVGGEVVATGKLDGSGTLATEVVMAKCPSKYEMKDNKIDPKGAALETKKLTQTP